MLMGSRINHDWLYSILATNYFIYYTLLKLLGKSSADSQQFDYVQKCSMKLFGDIKTDKYNKSGIAK